MMCSLKARLRGLAQEKVCFIFGLMKPFPFSFRQPRMAFSKGNSDLLLTLLRLLPSGN
jgi:hypothetical protein